MPLRVERVLDHFLYPPQAIADAQEAFREHCALEVFTLGPTRSAAVIEVPGDDAQQSREIALSLLNYALDRAAQLHFEQA